MFHGALSGFLHLGVALLTSSRMSGLQRILPLRSEFVHLWEGFFKAKDIILTKTLAQIVQFYYLFKMTDHYQVWKRQYSNAEREICRTSRTK